MTSKTLVLSKDEWTRLQAQIQPPPTPPEEKLRQEKLRLHELSRQQASSWPETIEGQRQQKIQAKAVREAKEEERRMLQDIEEARIQAEKRKAAISRARELQYLQNDKVKGFQSAVLLSEVLKEREKQIEIKRLKEQMLRERDLEFERMVELESDTMSKTSTNKLVEDKKKALLCAEAQFQQAAEKRQLRLESRERMMQEAETIAQEADLFLQEQREREVRRKEQKRNHREELSEQLDMRLENMKIEKQQLQDEEERNLVYARAKERMMQARYDHEMSRVKEKEEQTRNIQTKLADQLKKQADNEDERIAKAVEQQLAAQEKAAAEKEKKRLEELESIRQFTEQEIARKGKIRQKDEDEKMEFYRKCDEEYDQHCKQEREKAAKKKEGAISVQNELDEMRKERRSMKSHDRAESAKMRELQADYDKLEEAVFQRYAQGKLRDLEARGYNVVPLVKKINDSSPTLSATHARTQNLDESDKFSSSFRRVGNPAPGNTTKRLGFA